MSEAESMKGILLGSAFLVLTSTAVSADTTPRWTVVLAAGAPAVRVPNLPPSSTYGIDAGQLAESGTGQLAFDLWGPVGNGEIGLPGLWHDTGAGAAPFASRDATGATGPGRSGGEAGHVFRMLDWMMDSSGDGHIAFGGFAGDPAQPIEAVAEGVWIFDGQRNTEIARAGTDGPLGPQLGAGWIFDGFDSGDSGEVIATAMNGGGAFLRSRTHGPSSGDVVTISRYSTGSGLSPCMLQGSSDPALASGIDGSPFSDIEYRLNAIDDAVYARASIGSGDARRDGIWEFCNGAPRALALTGVTGPLGPGIATVVDARFSDVSYAIAPASGETFYFSATAVASPGAVPFHGVYLHTPSGNRPVVLDDGSVATGMPGRAFDFDWQPSLFSAANQVVMLARTVDATDGGHRDGLWRLAAGQPPRPIALTGPDSPYPPAAGDQWTAFALIAVFANGEIGALAQTNSGIGLWRLHDGQPPVRVLSSGDSVSVPTSTGTVIAPVTDIVGQLWWDVMPRTVGRDRWYSENGDALVQVRIAGFSDTLDPMTWIRGNILSDAVFANGFD